MFYAHFVLSKRGPLARIWLAAHWDKKLTKAHVFETNLEDSVETIISPQVKMALRTSGHLLLGVVRIYNRKAKYLLADCNEAFVKIKMAFRPGVVDLPEENIEAQPNQIYLPEIFHNFDTPLPDITDYDLNRRVTTINQSHIDDITMPDEISTTTNDGELGTGITSFGRSADDMYAEGAFQSMFFKDSDAGMGTGGTSSEANDLTFGLEKDGDLAPSFMEPGLFGTGTDGGLFGEEPRRKSTEEEPMETTEGAIDNQVFSPAPQQPQIETAEQELIKQPEHIVEPSSVNELPQVEQPPPDIPPPVIEPQQEDVDRTVLPAEATANDQTTLVANEEEAFALEPLDITGIRDMRMRRKRKLIIDHVMELDGQTMREQLKDFNDIVTTLDMAPPTKKLMQWKEMGGVEKLFSLPSDTAGNDVNKIFGTNLHNSIPNDLLDLTSTQLHQQFGDNSEESVHADRPAVSTSNVNPFEENTTVEPNDTINSGPLISGNDPKMFPTVDNNVLSDDDYSVGQPTPGSVSDVDENPAPPVDMPSFDENVAPQPSPEGGEAYADDVDDLRWNTRTQHLLGSLQRSFKHEHEVSFFQMTNGTTRKQAVSKFYSLLVLAKQEATLLTQGQMFGDIFIKKGPKFDSILMN